MRPEPEDPIQSICIYCEAFFSEKAIHVSTCMYYTCVRFILVQVLHISLPLSRPCSCRVLNYYYTMQGTCLQLTTWREREREKQKQKEREWQWQWQQWHGVWESTVHWCRSLMAMGNGNTNSACMQRGEEGHACIACSCTHSYTETEACIYINTAGNIHDHTVTYVQPTHFHTWHIERVRSCTYS